MFQTLLRKILPWAVRLSAYNYTCVQIRGFDNVWAALSDRWSALVTICHLVRVPVLLSSSSYVFTWRTLEEILSFHSDHAEELSLNLVFIDGLWQDPAHAVWVPDAFGDLHHRLGIIAYTGSFRYRGDKAMKSSLCQISFLVLHFLDICIFMRACIHSLRTTREEKVLRPYGPSVIGSTPNAMVQFDYIKMSPRRTGKKYVLLLKDDHLGDKGFLRLPTQPPTMLLKPLWTGVSLLAFQRC